MPLEHGYCDQPCDRVEVIPADQVRPRCDGFMLASERPRPKVKDELCFPTVESLCQVDWFTVPETLATRGYARELREHAVAAGARVLDFSQCKWIAFTAADELVCNGDWEATTGESPEVREIVERALRRRGMLR